MKIFQNYTKVSANNLNPVYTALQLLLSILLLMWLACSKPTVIVEPDPTVATLTTATVNTIAQTAAQSGGNITADGGSAITARGVIWSTSASPTIADSKTIDGTGKGNFTSSITGLTANTTYYTRAYATNSIGTAYGNEVSFTTAEIVVMPVLTTTDVTVITPTTAKSGGNITVGGTTISARGICWSTTANPTVADAKTNNGTGDEVFTSFSTSLAAGTKYYVRAYATNSAGTAYGNEVSFTTLPALANKVYDIDGNVYNTVTIGTQVWMLENLKTTHYANGEEILSGLSDASWETTTSGALGVYNNDEANNTIYGKLYNWYAAIDTRKIAPAGWHVPTETEWTTLTDFLGGSNTAGLTLKEAGLSHWVSPNTGATNSSGFTGLPGGYRNTNGVHDLIGNAGWWWSTTDAGGDEANALGLFTYLDEANIVTGKKGFGTSVRCIKD